MSLFDFFFFVNFVNMCTIISLDYEKSKIYTRYCIYFVFSSSAIEVLKLKQKILIR